MTEIPQTSNALFLMRGAVVQAIYTRLLEALRSLGPFQEEPKKTSIHLVRTVGFAGVYPRKNYLYLNLRTDHPIENTRITKVEQASKNCYHNELKLTSPDEIIEELLDWIKEAFELG